MCYTWSHFKKIDIIFQYFFYFKLWKAKSCAKWFINLSVRLNFLITITDFSWYYRPDLDIVTLKPSCRYQFKKKKEKWSDLKILIEILNNLETFQNQSFKHTGISFWTSILQKSQIGDGEFRKNLALNVRVSGGYPGESWVFDACRAGVLGTITFYNTSMMKIGGDLTGYGDLWILFKSLKQVFSPRFENVSRYAASLKLINAELTDLWRTDRSNHTVCHSPGGHISKTGTVKYRQSPYKSWIIDLFSCVLQLIDSIYQRAYNESSSFLVLALIYHLVFCHRTI